MEGRCDWEGNSDGEGNGREKQMEMGREMEMEGIWRWREVRHGEKRGKKRTTSGKSGCFILL